MAQIRGQLIVPGQTNNWHPISVEDIGGNNFALKVSNIYGTLNHYNGNAEILESNIVFNGTTKSILIENLHATQDVEISFDSGVNFFVIKAGKSLDLFASVAGLKVKANGASTPYQILTTE